MKKSAVTEIIAEFLRGYEDSGFDEEREDDAFALLSELEKAGMKPPTFYKYEGKDSFPPDGIPVMFFGWEPE